MSKTLIAVAVLVSSVLSLAACGESSEEKATKQTCSAVKEINTQIAKLASLPISSSFPTEAKASVSAIDKSLGEIKSAAPNLEPARTQEVEAANKSFAVELAGLTKSVASAGQTSSTEAALKSAEPQIQAALTKLAAQYKAVYTELKCS